MLMALSCLLFSSYESSLIGLNVDGISETSRVWQFFLSLGFYFKLKLPTVVLQNVSDSCFWMFILISYDVVPLDWLYLLSIFSAYIESSNNEERRYPFCSSLWLLNGAISDIL